MAIMFPKKCNEKINGAEKNLFEKLELGLDEKVVCYHNYDIGTKETDFIVVWPGKGICIIEVKSWNGNRIEKVEDNDTILYYGNDGELKEERSPLKQCKNYCYELRDKVKSELCDNVKIIPIVCFPFMTEYVYNEKQLNIVTPRERTILQDDLEDNTQLRYIIKQKLDNQKIKDINEFNEQRYVNICSMFEDKANVENRIKQYMPKRKAQRLFVKKYYSILSYLKLGNKEEFEKQLDQYYSKWSVGTKIILVVDNKDITVKVLEYLSKKIDENMPYLTRYKEFRVFDNGKYNNRIFNFEIYGMNNRKSNENTEPFEIIDGQEYFQYDSLLKGFDKDSDFNYKQYEIEHACDEKNILIKAGAGTGKTYSMVSRIAFLYYTKNYIPEDLIKSIIMITFTNDAADNMKIRLKQYFTSLSILTEEIEYLHIIENISRMNISTIHSLMKKIIQSYSKYLGVGNQIAITTEIYNRRKEIDKQLELIIKKDEYKNVLSKIRKYEISKAVEKLLDMLEKKNIDLTEEKSLELFAPIETENKLFDLILEIATNSQANMIEEHIADNKVHLSNLSIYIKRILKAIDRDTTDNLIDYVFIDEFQDTDDNTIEIITEYYNIFKFKLFVVGDIKQSIYRFRGADDEAFDKLQNGIGNWIENKENGKKYLTINKNYRSVTELLEDFHKLFMEWKSGIDRYNRIFKYSEDDKLIGVNSSSLGNKKVEPAYYKEKNFKEVLIQTIEEKLKLLDEKYKDKDKKGTIAILTRNNEEIKEIRTILKDKFTVDTDRMENLYKMEPTIDLYRLVLGLQYYKNPKYLYSLSLSNYAKSISDKVVYNNRNNRKRILQAFNENKIIDNWNSDDINKVDNTIIGKLKQEPILRVIREIIKQTKPWEQYAANFPEDERKSARINYKRNLDLLIEKIIMSSTSEYITINYLAKYLYIMIFANQHQDERKLYENTDKHKIKCLTIHKSKGLEYDYTILPFTHKKLNKRHGNEIVISNEMAYINFTVREADEEREIEKVVIRSENYYKNTNQEIEDLIKEETRILYVALTRAKESVVWFKNLENDKDDSSKKDVTWCKLLERGCEDETFN